MKICDGPVNLGILVAICLIPVPALFGQQNLVDLKVTLKKEHVWTDDSNRPSSDTGKFTVPGAGYAKFTFSGTPLLDQHIFSYKLAFPGSNQGLLPGTGVDSNKDSKKDVLGQPFVWWWVTQFTEDQVGMEVTCTLVPRQSYEGGSHWVYPAQDLLMRVEWLGKDYTPSKSNSEDIDVAGIWKHGDGGETWTLVPDGIGKYKATENGFQNASGTATVSGNELTIDYKTSDGKTAGKYVIKIAADGNSGVGKWSPSGGESGERNFTKIGSVIPTTTGPQGVTSTGNQPPGGATTGPGTQTIPESGLVLQIESRSVQEGGSTTVPVWLHRVADLANMNFEVSYQADVAKATSVEKGKFLPNSTSMESNARDAGIIRIGFAGRNDLSGTGPIAHIPFDAVGKGGTRTPLTLKVTTAASIANKEPAVQLVHGFIEVVSAVKPGDSNGNGIIDSGDALDALKMSVKLIPENKAADIDQDGNVTSIDARLILEQVVKQPGLAQ